MKRMLKLQIADSSYCLLSYKKHLEELKKTAREGKDPHCTKCDEFGFVKGSKSIVPIICYCVSDEKSKIEKKIEDLEIIIKRYNTVFNKLDNDMTLNIFAERFNNQKLVSSIKKYLELGSMNSLYIEGESGTGKTTMLKMLWQIYAINNIKALYMKASIFEDMHKNLFNKNAQDRDLKSSIDAKIDNIKFADIIMIDDIDSVGFHYAAEGYYKLFDKIRELEKTVILTSNKSYIGLMNSLNIKTRKDNIDEIKGRLTSRLKNLNIIELEMQKFEIKPDKLAS
ncbi:DnaA/Hda family protein [Brachyspira hyodysenteriae]|uniref:DnaA ATPase domain-containing protein n=1 Tax=Brachyspira hyodysenteriae TaxID=159 RepID=UPI0022CD3C65|nr:DnaA/Hda family protein [Brachyspira hyodysenteriae]MCZ9979068.1 DnaA/Hda family protein [Brachyspira hyodysenteriae]MCZ9994104.1 DnaA/Hda family protein [Brachyspira hyodysenteriae]MDA0042864.1 DnaA/Hda family protein [Brachyspira hyodysenteriae]MDA0057686.1 DnaA/Hda family protein [Brachyspira hyodysenteriae]MDA0061122.1 DnaA/Hda family protein [Brachyspira hyodysenteriae]